MKGHTSAAARADTAAREKPLPLLHHQVHLWLAFVPDIDAQAAQGWQAMLEPYEREKQERFVFEKDRHRYLITRALVRTTLSRYAGIAPEDWRFAAGPHGKPQIANPPAWIASLRFNVSHTAQLVALAITWGRDIGIDVEGTRGRRAPLEVADHFFSASEASALRALPAGEQAARFWELWTFKESYLKARGMGLSLGLDSFSIDLSRSGRVALVSHGEAQEQSRWQLKQFRPDDSHLLAICAEATPAECLDVIAHRFTAAPLQRMDMQALRG